MSWWDYGYQITAMANRTILVDNNTWNNTHISRVGQVTQRAYHVFWLRREGKIQLNDCSGHYHVNNTHISIATFILWEEVD